VKRAGILSRAFKPDASDATPTDPLGETPMNFGLSKWAGQDSNLRHPACKGGRGLSRCNPQPSRCLAVRA
jgi:hypothetical protein